LVALASSSSAQAVTYLQLGTSNASNATTTLTGSASAAELKVMDTNGSASTAGVLGLLTATSPTVNSAALRGQNNATNAFGYGVYGSQAGHGIGVSGFAPTGTGVRGQSTSGIGVFGQHTATSGTTPGVSASTNSTADDADALVATVTPTSPGLHSAAVRGQNDGNGASGYGVWGSQAGSGSGVYGYSPQGRGVTGGSTSGTGARGASLTGVGVSGLHSASNGIDPGVSATTNSMSVDADALVATVTPTAPGALSAAVRGINNGTGTNGIGVYGSQNGSATGVYGVSPHGYGVYGTSSNGDGVYGISSSLAGVVGYSTSNAGVFADSAGGNGILGLSQGKDGIRGITPASGYSGIYGENTSSSNYAGWFKGNVEITGTCTGCVGPSGLQIDDPLDPAHKYLQHSSVASSQQLDIYSGNVTTNGKGFATVTMPGWFQALNRNFRYQLTSLSGLQAVAVAKEIAHNRFTIQSEKPHAKVSWQVTGIRHDRFAKAHPVRVVVPKAKKDQGRYLHPELYGKPKSEGIGYRKLPRLPRMPTQKR